MPETKKIIFISLLVAQGVTISLVESTIPYPFPFAPGAKMGLANITTVLSLFIMRKKEVFFLIWLRVLLSTLLGGTVSTFLYSISGALLSFVGMIFIKKMGNNRVSCIGISAIGGFLHNVGQLIIASLIAQSWSVMNYLPVLSLLGILSGIIIGILANTILLRFKVLRPFIL
ncbi:Gx transporter family protein [Enterococcus sp.]|uniref:Gx transporter family protein n=1 Tax=Enterococcus sp. TaxID=35783 RepID=UPI00290DC387|nr:Gx transporter family protein [Enterococcus sp.]MDU5336714.1 Gx transporter family protein [Enterococcus sp.]